jgi:pimeloyl-ACP methyl ester carboxylesterase
MSRLRRLGPASLLPVLFVLLVCPFLIPVPPLRDTFPPQQLADPDSLFVNVDGLSVHYKTVGRGEPTLVLLHGFGASVFSWREVMAPLAQLGRTVAFDRPAFGLTERPLPGQWQAASPYSAAAQVSLTIGLMDELGVKQGILVGNSAGGTIAMMTALQHPERVRALILVSPAVYGQGGARSLPRLLYSLPQVRHLAPLVVRSLVGQLEASLPTAWHDPAKISPEVLAGYRKPLQVENWDRAFWEFLSASRPTDLGTQLRQLRLPTLVVTGDDDTWVPTAQSVRLAGELPNAKLAVIPNCGHVSHEECPAEFMQVAAGFLGTLSGG